jgi:hypothetical protein
MDPQPEEPYALHRLNGSEESSMSFAATGQINRVRPKKVVFLLVHFIAELVSTAILSRLFMEQFVVHNSEGVLLGAFKYSTALDHVEIMLIECLSGFLVLALSFTIATKLFRRSDRGVMRCARGISTVLVFSLVLYLFYYLDHIRLFPLLEAQDDGSLESALLILAISLASGLCRAVYGMLVFMLFLSSIDLYRDTILEYLKVMLFPLGTFLSHFYRIPPYDVLFNIQILSVLSLLFILLLLIAGCRFQEDVAVRGPEEGHTRTFAAVCLFLSLPYFYFFPFHLVPFLSFYLFAYVYYLMEIKKQHRSFWANPCSALGITGATATLPYLLSLLAYSLYPYAIRRMGPLLR